MNTDQLWHPYAAAHNACNPARRLPKTRVPKAEVENCEFPDCLCWQKQTLPKHTVGSLRQARQFNKREGYQNFCLRYASMSVVSSGLTV